MPIPEFFHFIRPALEFHADQKTHHWRDVEAKLANDFHLSEEERKELIPSGRKTRLGDRVLWALTYLRQARLLESPNRGYNRITTRGIDYLKRAPQVITPNSLIEFPEFAEFIRVKPTATAESNQAVTLDKALSDTTQTPEEALATAYEKLNAALAQEVLERVKKMPPASFERLIVELMLKLGYGGSLGSGQAIGKPGDEGVDGVINQDKLGLDKIYLQAKRWGEGSVGRKEVQAFVGALSGHGANKGVFITSSTFTKDAIEYTNRMLNVKISLVDGLELARLLIENDLGVALVQRYDVKRVDSDFFAEE